MVQFEYMTVVLSSKDMDDAEHRLAVKLNKYGEKGWELASAITQPCLGSSQYNLLGIAQKNILVFKRRSEHNKEGVE